MPATYTEYESSPNISIADRMVGLGVAVVGFAATATVVSTYVTKAGNIVYLIEKP